MTDAKYWMQTLNDINLHEGWTGVTAFCQRIRQENIEVKSTEIS